MGVEANGTNRKARKMLECEHDHGDATRDDTIMMPVTNTTLATSDSVLETSALHVIRTSILTNIQEKHLSYSNSAFILTFLLSFTTGALPVFLQERIILMRETSSGSYRISSYDIAKRGMSPNGFKEYVSEAEAVKDKCLWFNWHSKSSPPAVPS